MGGRRPPTQVIPGRPPRGVPVSRPLPKDYFGGRRRIPPEICPDPEMGILMADGSQKKAGDLLVGDLVKTYHEESFE